MMVEELLGAYALDAVDEDERLTVDRHLATCAPCREEVANHREIAAVLAGLPIPPPDRVWDRILAEIAATAPPAQHAKVVPLHRRQYRLTALPARWLAGAAAAVAVVALAATVTVQSGRIADLNDQITAQQKAISSLDATLQADPLQMAVALALENPDARVANLATENSEASMSVVLLPDGTGYVFESNLRGLSEDATYQLWAVVDNRVISAGILGSNPSLVPFHLDLAGLQGLAITEEVAGGVVQSEADPVVAWFEG